ncbi:MAG: hypothetical protein QM756_35345 [Polyangiaceae bacterium]
MSATLTTAQRFYLSAVPVGASVFVAITASKSPLLGVLLIHVLLAALAWYSSLSIPRVTGVWDRRLFWDAPLGGDEISLSEITEIDARRWYRRFVRIRTRRRTVYFLRSMPGLTDIFSTIARRNPQLTVRGDLSFTNR